MASVSAFVVHWNAPQWCVETVASIAAQGIDVTVVNNGGVIDLRDATVIEVGRNRGFAAGANIGLAAAMTNYVLLCCHDARLSVGSVDAMVEAMESDVGLGIIGPAINGVGGDEHDLDWISGTAMLIRHEVLDNVRFDERFGSYVEDVDFCYRARDFGWRVGRCAAAVVSTEGSVDSDAAYIRTQANTIVFAVRRRYWRWVAYKLREIAADRRCLRCLAETVRCGRRFVVNPSRRAASDHRAATVRDGSAS